jgi:hypothetical protein
MMALIGVGGPALSNNTFQVGIDNLGKTIKDSHQEYIDYDRDSKTKTFGQKYGDALETRVLRLCSVGRELDLPEVHRLLVNAPRGREYSILNNLLSERAVSSPLSIDADTAPMATPQIMDSVFKSYTPMNDGLILGDGLSPFAIICQGHSQTEFLKREIKKREMIALNAAVSLTDAELLTTTDAHLPTECYMAVDKLNGWSVMIDVFHGSNAPISLAVRNAVHIISPKLQRLVHQVAISPAEGVEQVCRIMHEMQPEHYAYLHLLSRGTTLPAPDFSEVITAVSTLLSSQRSSRDLTHREVPTPYGRDLSIPTRE